MSVDISRIVRSRGGLIETQVLKPRGADGTALVGAVREHWSTLRAKGFAASYPIQISWATEESPRVVVYTFKWNGTKEREVSRNDQEILGLVDRIGKLSEPVVVLGELNEVYQGFDYRHFPDTGGLELLKGKCNCVVNLSGTDFGIPLNAINGFVLMHRAPGRDVDGDGSREMYVSILDHGADCNGVTTAKFGPALRQMGFEPPLQMFPSLRIGQNRDLPQYGLIRAQTSRADFPATAMWVVHWRIWTNMGILVTDPNVPLVFGPTTVQHYPPVGTEFHSSTGPVRLIHEPSGQVVGTLTPGELTAFDIVVTKDDEIPSDTLNQSPQDLVRLFNERTAALVT